MLSSNWVLHKSKPVVQLLEGRVVIIEVLIFPDGGPVIRAAM